MISRALLKVGYACNNNCVYCHSAPHRGQDSELAPLQKKIREAASQGAGMLVLSGGEPTIRTDLIEIADSIQDSGMRLGLVTNGRMLVYQNLTDRLLERGLDYLYVSLCGAEAELHDRHVGNEGFTQTTRALKALAGKVGELTVNVVVTSWNLESLADFLRLAARWAPLRLKFSMIEPEGNVLSDFDGLVPAIGKAAATVTRLIDSAPSGSGLAFSLDGFPLCLIPDHLELDSGLRDDGFFIMSEAFESSWYPVDERNKAFGSSCPECSLRRRCKGVFRQYLRRRGDSELTPVTRPVSNSFNLEPVGREEKLDLRSCPIRAGTRAAPDPIRGLMLQTSEHRIQRYLIDTRDFSDESIQQAVRILGQVYRDTGSEVLIDDFPRQLGRLRLHSSCRKCGTYSACPGVWQAVDEAPFERAREYLSRLLSSVSGRALDVGCGLRPYQEALRPALESGELDYLGIDPRKPPEPADRRIKYIQSSLEDFSWDAEPFDTVLALRSLNHLKSVSEGIRKLGSLTRSGGRLILAEDTVFGVIRPAEKLGLVRTVDSLPFEHQFNLTLEEAETLLARNGFQVGIKKSPRELGSTLWITVGYKT